MPPVNIEKGQALLEDLSLRVTAFNELNVFVRLADGRIAHFYQANSRWYVRSLTDDSNWRVEGAPSVSGIGGLKVFARGVRGRLFYFNQQGNNWTVENLGGDVAMRPSLARYDLSPSTGVVSTDSGGALWKWRVTPGGVTGPLPAPSSQLTGLHGEIATYGVMQNDDYSDLAMIDSAGQLFRWRLNPNNVHYDGPVYIDNGLQGYPVGSSYRNQRHIVACGQDGQPWHYFDGGNWVGRPLGESMATSPALSVWRDQFHVLAGGRDGVPHHWWYGDSGWSHEALRGFMDQIPDITTTNSVFYVYAIVTIAGNRQLSQWKTTGNGLWENRLIGSLAPDTVSEKPLFLADE